ncbi:flagellar assembly peptidoglycan hydrolase FlgJ [Hydrogenophaga sp.]|uniref:flagellar assembly peptidoglycan hydrolase FlgJ n=1 Tax=Hydrogenophaga sp. TaxID=1904254 RepID=UPI0027337523|nr:flagellar assembly peptidoglycan hydrolase FlgJ [Hydrogenophaga sp.]MDP3107047.1 flagellar assembly peptidoglycan hydrolase FlgJ [Hydrogenophaga sp.]MDZ4280527.1 flagellar assembly peptidoglycan hydrolase FlgJ [Hydrogenophaga sp.]
MNPTSALSSNGLAADPTALNALRYGAGKGNDKAALKEAAKQFESLFMRELIKSMREATQKSGLMDGEGSDLGTDLLDQQFAVQLSGLPGGLSEAIERQLGKQMQNNAAEKAGAVNALPASSDVSTVGRASAGPRQAGFVEQHSLAAAAVARESGIPASYMIGQAGHETGWGRSEIRHADGTPSHNLFGIKATGGWKGKVAEITTTEYINGEPRKVTAKFRAYDSYADSFRDYASLIGNSPRYDKVMDQLGSVQGFAAGLQKAGYATDPQYAAKLSRAINTTLSLQRAQG